MLLPRYYNNLGNYLKPGKILVLFGPRQVGKTTLVKEFLKTSEKKSKYDSGEFLNTQNILSSRDLDTLKKYLDGYSLVAIDEAHKIPHIGLNLKLIADHIPNISIIATGSSSFDLLGQVGEPLVGRKVTLRLFPVSQLELTSLYNAYELESRLEEWLLYGGYPEVLITDSLAEKMEILEEIVQGYLLKDILELEKVKTPKMLVDLLTLIALQVGCEVSLSEIGQKLGIDVKTVARYLDLLEKSFILLNLRGFSRNLRNEVTRTSKYYFYDTGIRNALISNFNPLAKRSDTGAIWENFLVVERLKYQEYKKVLSNNYFWRTWEGKEIDWVEERGGNLFGYEFKYKEDRTAEPKLWKEAYPGAEFKVVTSSNYLEFVR